LSLTVWLDCGVNKTAKNDGTTKLAIVVTLSLSIVLTTETVGPSDGGEVPLPCGGTTNSDPTSIVVLPLNSSPTATAGLPAPP
jgi:hypothetical protein